MGNVTTLKTVDSSVISLIILVFILINSYNRTDKLFRAHKLFTTIVLINIFMILVDYLARVFDGYPGGAFILLNAGFNSLLYIAAPAAPIMWLLYVNYQIFKDERRLDKLKPALLALFVINAAISIVSLFTGWYFNVDAQNIYHRGPLFLVHVLLNYALMAYSVIIVFKNRRIAEKRYFLSMLLFFVPSVIGTLIQIHVYGVSYNWVGMALSVLIIYFNIQNRGLSIDYLTGAYNKRQFDSYTMSRIKGGNESPFSAIMLDLDNMKEINDTLGHDVGDEALKDTVSIIRCSIRENDFIARVGGDEFVVILDIQNNTELERAKKRIEESVAEFNASGGRPYNISFSYGSGVFDPRQGRSPEEFFKEIDTLMYEEKARKKAGLEG